MVVSPPVALAVTTGPHSSWVDSDDSFDLCLMLCESSLPPFDDTPRSPTAAAPWPEPPSQNHTKTFSLFPFLPSSLRHRIWLLALPGPRVIEIQYNHKQHKFRSQLPALLRVSREARSVALLRYELAAASPLDRLDSALGNHFLTFVDWEVDTFCPKINFRSFVTGEWKTFLRTLPNCERIQRFGLRRHCFLFPSSACIPLLLRYESLREVVVLQDPCLEHYQPGGLGGGRGDGDGEGWRVDEGKVLPTLEEFRKAGGKERLERYVIEFMDRFRRAWSEEHAWDLRVVYKRVCWGGKCWESDGVVDVREGVKGKRNHVIKRILSMPRRGVAKVAMFFM